MTVQSCPHKEDGWCLSCAEEMVDDLDKTLMELHTRRENFEIMTKRLIATENERNIYRMALEEIRTNYGKVCQEFELCEHPACASSYGAWAVADEALCSPFSKELSTPDSR